MRLLRCTNFIANANHHHQHQRQHPHNRPQWCSRPQLTHYNQGRVQQSGIARPMDAIRWSNTAPDVLAKQEHSSWPLPVVVAVMFVDIIPRDS